MMKKSFSLAVGSALIPTLLVAALSLPDDALSQDMPVVPYLPLVQEVSFPPSPIRSGGEVHLFYELHLTNFLAREVTLLSVDVLDEEGRAAKTLGKSDIAARLVRAGRRPNPDDTCILESGIRAVLFLQVTFDDMASIPDSLTHRVTAELARRGGENSTMRSVGRPVRVSKKAPLVLGPPIRPGIWLAGNGAGDGPVGHRLSMQTWDGRLVVNQRYALDFMKLGGNNLLFKGESSVNGNWWSYGEEVLAVAAGVILEVKDGIVENTPGEGYAVPGDLENAAGNYVVLKIGPETYVDYAHFRPNSLRVKAGDKVRKGQVLGLVGNSGISDAPHLHFHVSDATSFFGGESIPFVFEEFELLGPFDTLDENLEKPWTPQGPGSMRREELPLGDHVIRTIP